MLIPWDALQKKANISRKQAKALEVVGYREGAIPRQWMGCLHQIAVSDLRIEILDGDEWVNVQDPSLVELPVWEEPLKKAA